MPAGAGGDFLQELVQVLPGGVVNFDLALGLLQEQRRVLPAQVVNHHLGLGLLLELQTLPRWTPGPTADSREG